MNIIGKRNIFLIFSGTLIILGIAALSIWGLNFGIDFKGGTLLELQFNKKISSEQIQTAIDQLDFTKSASIQISNGDTALIRTKQLDKDQEQKIKSLLNEKVGEYQEKNLQSIGPTVSQDLTKKAIIAVILASIGIVIYVAIAFRAIPKPTNSWRFGLTAIIAMVHDLFIVISVFAILGHFYDFEINSLFITALLTILGYSVNDTIVIFDRIRENLKKHPSLSFAENTNNSINQTLARSINTVFTVLLVLYALLILGGGSIHQFIIALIIGITMGAYSSIFIAPAALVIWQNFSDKKLKLAKN